MLLVLLITWTSYFMFFIEALKFCFLFYLWLPTLMPKLQKGLGGPPGVRGRPDGGAR